MTELVDSPTQGRFEELLGPPQEPLLPFMLLASNFWLQLPPGNIAYIDTPDPSTIPDTVLMLDQKGIPVKHKGHTWKRPFDEPQMVPAYVVHTPAREQDGLYDELLQTLRTKITRSEDHTGVLAVVEPKGTNPLKGWRKEELIKAGFVSTDVQVIDANDKWITVGRVQKMHKPQNRTTSSEYRATNARLNTARKAGLSVDQTNLENDAKSTRNVARTETNLRNLNGIIITDGVCSYQTSIRGLIHEIHKCDNPSEHHFEIPQSQAQIDKLLINQFKTGKLKDIELEPSCGDCGEHYVNRYSPSTFDDTKSGNRVSLLWEQQGCNGTKHRRGGFVPVGQSRKVGFLGSRKIEN